MATPTPKFRFVVATREKAEDFASKTMTGRMLTFYNYPVLKKGRVKDMLRMFNRIPLQKIKVEHKRCGLHDPKVEPIFKRIARRPYGFEVKVSSPATLKENIDVGIIAILGNPWEEENSHLPLNKLRLLYDQILNNILDFLSKPNRPPVVA